MKCFILPAHKTFALKPVKCHFTSQITLTFRQEGKKSFTLIKMSSQLFVVPPVQSMAHFRCFGAEKCTMDS